MQIIFIRHGEPNYEGVTRNQFIGHGRDLAELTSEGISQAERVSKDRRLIGAELILSSPYTRALQTAAIISKNIGLDLRVELALHEWLPDTTFRYRGPEHFPSLMKEVSRCHGEHNSSCSYEWESFSEVRKRAENIFSKYIDCGKIIVVTHGLLIRQFVPQDKISYCGISEMKI
ncbi:MAG: histidine phosphatase family protein [Sporolactobacillus sp.]